MTALTLLVELANEKPETHILPIMDVLYLQLDPERIPPSSRTIPEDRLGFNVYRAVCALELMHSYSRHCRHFPEWAGIAGTWAQMTYTGPMLSKSSLGSSSILASQRNS